MHSIETLRLVKTFGGITALNGLDLCINEGEIYGFLGPNGAGKTTTIRILTGTARPTSGTASVCGINVLVDPVAAKSHIGVVSQHVNLDPDLTVAENLELHGILHKMSKADRRERAGELLLFAELADRRDSPSKTLSGGMKRKLTIIRALMHRPKVLFLDEPTTGLDAAARRRAWDLIRSIRSDGVTVFLTTHYIEEAEALSDRVGIIHKGRMIDEGAPSVLVARLGTHAVDYRVDGETRSGYFGNREEALNFLADKGEGSVIRRTNLEDLFLKETGMRVGP